MPDAEPDMCTCERYPVPHHPGWHGGFPVAPAFPSRPNHS
ncbi:hypothetical protein SEA_ROBSFEET_85 [Microbacterium phage RobsFeet]|uniref:Uncharacterized protein n=1 Tax=Microbacterium phage RobsFeet TaxID=2201442 RepID=A0A2Z4Q7T2_9CAUD|nr:hypothetical protein HOT43_gp87 [Microbacterium phage RobsFeet]AWY06091.1 hypothetical protein SEA_ROBSFEET_85 [Microbacterium phage RobsFeet]